MGKIFLSLVMLILVVSLSGCNQITTKENNKDNVKINNKIQNNNQQKDTHQGLMQETLRIQMDKTMSKEEKAAALEDIQRRNKKILDDVLAK